MWKSYISGCLVPRAEGNCFKVSAERVCFHSGDLEYNAHSLWAAQKSGSRTLSVISPNPVSSPQSTRIRCAEGWL